MSNDRPWRRELSATHTNKQLEHKLLDLEAAEFKFDGETGMIEGYASVFNGIDAYGDTVLPGAYKRTLKERSRSVKMRFNHLSQVVGKWLDIKETAKGLRVRGQLTPGHSLAADVLASLKHGAIDGLSIGYIPIEGEKNEHGGRDLKDIELVEISVVEEPADLAARIHAVKSVIDEATSLKEIEGILRDAGFSRDAATALVSRTKSLIHGEREANESEVISDIQQFRKQHGL